MSEHTKDSKQKVISGTWEEYLNYTEYCQSVIKYYQQITDHKYDVICQSKLPSIEEWRKMNDV